MLSKIVCIRCINSAKGTRRITKFEWGDADEATWLISNLVNCHLHVMVTICEAPPKWCPYAFEHAVATIKGTRDG